MKRGAARILILAVAGALATGAARADIVVGVAGPLSLDLAIFGEQMRDGAAQAIADINAGGGVNGQRLVLAVLDDRCEAKRADAVANEFAGKGAALIVGHLCLAASLAAAPVYAAKRIVQITPGTTYPAYTDQRAGPGVFRVCGRDDQQGQVAGAFLASRFGGSKIAIVDDQTDYGQGLADATRTHLNAARVKEAMNESYEPGGRDYTALVAKLDAAGIEVVYIGGAAADAGLIVRQMRERGMTAVPVSGDALISEEYWRITGKAGAGAIMTFSPDPAKDPANAALVKVFTGKGIRPEGYVLYAYAAVQVWAEAARAAGSIEFDAVVKALNDGTFKTVLGELKFDEKGDVTLPGYVFYEWQDGAYDTLN